MKERGKEAEATTDDNHVCVHSSTSNTLQLRYMYMYTVRDHLFVGYL